MRISRRPLVIGPTLAALAALASLSVEEMEIALESLADFSADHLAEKLREALRKVREG